MHKYKHIISVSTFLVLITIAGLIVFILASANAIPATIITQKSTTLLPSIQRIESVTASKMILDAPIPRRPIEPIRIEQASDKKCTPWFAKTEDKYLCYAGSTEHPELWLASESKDIEKMLVDGELINFQWAYDDQHIVYSPWPDPSPNALVPPKPSSKPVFLLNVDTGERKEIGQTTLGWNIVSAPTGDIAFLDGDVIYMVNPLQGSERQVASALTTGRPPEPTPTDAQAQNTETEKIPDFLLTPRPEELIPLTQTNEMNGEALGCFPPDCEVRFRISPDGKKLALQQNILHRVTLVIVDIDTQKSWLITDQMAESWYPFAWSPDSQKVAYAIVPEETRTPELWIVNADGREPHQLVVAKGGQGLYEYITWLANAQDVLYVFSPGGASTGEWSEYQVVGIQGGEPYTLFTGGYGVEVFDGGRRIRFSRESVDGKFDPSSWTAVLSN